MSYAASYGRLKTVIVPQAKEADSHAPAGILVVSRRLRHASGTSYPQDIKASSPCRKTRVSHRNPGLV